MKNSLLQRRRETIYLFTLSAVPLSVLIISNATVKQRSQSSCGRPAKAGHRAGSTVELCETQTEMCGADLARTAHWPLMWQPDRRQSHGPRSARRAAHSVASGTVRRQK